VVFTETVAEVIGPWGWNGFLWDGMAVYNVIYGVLWKVSYGLGRMVCENTQRSPNIAWRLPIC